ncbi:MAG TPA: CopG family transcriptional regulator [Candidatus Saccharimonadia bacterium]|nr:CopG family transcriptional regulator [Candidatus Saccharimonadia bacterium]
MKSIQIELPEKLAAVLATIVQQGWFRSEEEVLRLALFEFLRRHPLALTEQFQREDIAWALRQKDAVE